MVDGDIARYCISTNPMMSSMKKRIIRLICLTSRRNAENNLRQWKNNRIRMHVITDPSEDHTYEWEAVPKPAVPYYPQAPDLVFIINSVNV